MRRRNHKRGVALLFLCIVAVGRGMGYLPGFEPAEIPTGIELLVSGLPILTVEGYGILWLIAAGCAFIGAFMQRDRFAFAAVILMSSLTAAVYTVSWIGSPIVTGWWNDDWRGASLYVGGTGALLTSFMRPGWLRRMLRRLHGLAHRIRPRSRKGARNGRPV